MDMLFPRGRFARHLSLRTSRLRASSEPKKLVELDSGVTGRPQIVVLNLRLNKLPMLARFPTTTFWNALPGASTRRRVRPFSSGNWRQQGETGGCYTLNSTLKSSVG